MHHFDAVLPGGHVYGAGPTMSHTPGVGTPKDHVGGGRVLSGTEAVVGIIPNA